MLETINKSNLNSVFVETALFQFISQFVDLQFIQSFLHFIRI